MKMLSICQFVLLVFYIFLYASKGVPVGVIPKLLLYKVIHFKQNLRILVWVAKSLAAGRHQSPGPFC